MTALSLYLTPSGGDDAPVILAALAQVGASGGGEVVLSPGGFQISQTLAITTSHTTLRGSGSDTWHDSGPISQPVTTIKWIGAPGSIGVHVYTPYDTQRQVIVYSGVRDLAIDGSAILGTGLQVTSVRCGNFENLYSHDCTLQSYLVTNYNKMVGWEPPDTQRCVFRRLFWRNYDFPAVHNAHGLVMGAQSPGVANANVSLNWFELCTGITVNGNAYAIGDCDNNTYVSCGSFVTGTGNGLIIAGGYSNYFWNYSGHAPTHIQGLASGAFQNTNGNCFFNVDEANGAPPPIVDPGCSVQWHGCYNGFYALRAQGLGLFGATPVTARPVITGAKGGNAALANLLTALADYGLITDSTT